MKNLSIISAWLSVIILSFMMWMLAGKFSRAEGLLFDLPSYGDKDGIVTDLVAIVFPSERDTLVFFDDSRYSLLDDVSLDRFRVHLSEIVGKSARPSLLVLTDKRVTADELMRLASTARRSGIEKLLMAERRIEKTVE